MTEDARRFADQMGIQLFETSAKVLVVGVVCWCAGELVVYMIWCCVLVV